MILTDTGYWLALANTQDHFHQQAIEITKTIESELIITWPVITETCHLLNSRIGSRAPIQFLQQVEQSTTIFELTIGHLPRVRVLMKKYQNLPMDMADASLVIAAEELQVANILSTDRRDFQAYRWKNHHPFKNLLLFDN